MAEDRRDVGLLAVTSADRLNAGWTGTRFLSMSPKRTTPGIVARPRQNEFAGA